jgi:hypothetical protein
MPRNTSRRGLYVHVYRDSDGPVSFRWNIHRRRTPLRVKLTGGGFPTFHAAHAAGSQALEELWVKILKEQASAAPRS